MITFDEFFHQSKVVINKFMMKIAQIKSDLSNVHFYAENKISGLRKCVLFKLIILVYHCA